MDAIDIARELSGDGRATPVENDPRRYFRVWDGEYTRLVKVDRSRLSHERELTVIDALDGVMGAPLVLETGQIDDWYWISFADPGRWNLLSIRGPEIGKQVGRTFSQIHELPIDRFPEPIITNEWIRIEHASVARQLRPLRGRLRIDRDLVEALALVPPPVGSTPRPAHLGPKARNVFVDDTGHVTLMGWEDGGVAAPEWDLAQTLAEAELGGAPKTAAAISMALEQDLGPIDLHRWTIFHTMRDLLARANNYESAGDVLPLLERLGRSIRIAVLEKQSA